MPGFVIHLAIAKKQLEKGIIKHEVEFIRGTIAPDILKEKGIESHYSKTSGTSNVKKFVETNDMNTDYNKGYFLHLITDVMFYKYIVKNWSASSIYNDYDILNKRIIEKYKISLPEEVKKYAFFKKGKLSILNYDEIIDFIEDIGNSSFEELYQRYIKEVEEKQ